MTIGRPSAARVAAGALKAARRLIEICNALARRYHHGVNAVLGGTCQIGDDQARSEFIRSASGNFSHS